MSMPLTMVKTGEKSNIKKIGGQEKTRKFLQHLGFVVGEDVTVISQICGNLIVHVKDTRIAISQEMASRILV